LPSGGNLPHGTPRPFIANKRAVRDMPGAAHLGTLTVPRCAARVRYGRNVTQVTYSVLAFSGLRGSSVDGEASASAVTDSRVLSTSSCG
jgi:hypothetical protein